MIKFYEGADKRFLEACEKATHANRPLCGNKGIWSRPTRRQHRKWREKRGAAFRAAQG